MKTIRIIFISIFCLIISTFMIFTLTNNHQISSVEKRSLKTYPTFKINKLLSESYYEELKEAFNDQLFLRNHLVKGYYLFQFQK